MVTPQWIAIGWCVFVVIGCFVHFLCQKASINYVSMNNYHWRTSEFTGNRIPSLRGKYSIQTGFHGFNCVNALALEHTFLQPVAMLISLFILYLLHIYGISPFVQAVNVVFMCLSMLGFIINTWVRSVRREALQPDFSLYMIEVNMDQLKTRYWLDVCFDLAVQDKIVYLLALCPVVLTVFMQVYVWQQ